LEFRRVLFRSYRSRINERDDAREAPGAASCFLLAIGLMATAAVLAQLTELSLEAFEVLRCLCRCFRLTRQLCKPGLEICLVFPDRRQGRGVASGFRAIGKQSGRFFAGLRESGERLVCSVEIERPFPLGHLSRNPSLIAVGLHQRFSRCNWISLGG